MSRVFLLIFCSIISLIDIKTRRIPDILLVFGLFLLVFFDVCAKNTDIVERTAAGSLFFLLFYLLFCLTGGAVGFGDVKFAGVLGYALTLDQAFITCFFSAFLCLVVYGVGMVCYHWEKSVKIPFAPFLGAGAMVAVFIW